MTEPTTKILSLDDIKAGLSDLAQNGEGAQRTQAYRMLMSMGSTDAILPEPLNDDEREDRLAKLMRGIGVNSVRRAYVKAFPKRATIQRIMADVGDTAIDIGIPIEKWPKTLRQLYRRCPELKAPGLPRGYPMGGGPLQVRDFIHKLFYKYHADKHEPAKQEALVELEFGTDHADGIARDGDEQIRSGDPATAGPPATQD